MERRRNVGISDIIEACKFGKIRRVAKLVTVLILAQL